MLRSFRSPARNRRKVLELTLRSITNSLQQGEFAEELSRRAGFLQDLDPRVKVVVALEFLISVSLSRDPWVIVAIYALALGLALPSSISPGLLLGRVWLFMPFFTIPLAIPALFLTPGPPQIELPFGWIITRSGMTAALFLLLRVSASLTWSLLLIYTTSWNMVLSALSSLYLPEAFALILGMTYRYVNLLLRAAGDMLMSRESRVVGQLSRADGRRLMAAAAGALLEKSLKLSGDVYLAMQSRGYHGPMTSVRRFEMQAKDWATALTLSLLAAICVWIGR